MAERWARLSVGRWLSGLLVSVTAVAAVSGLIALLDPRIPALSLLVLYILAVVVVATVWGTALAAVTSILSAVVFAFLSAPPVGSIQMADSRELAGVAAFLVTGVVVEELAARLRRQAQRSARLSEEQSALRRVATTWMG
jgi:K+-sensing histidine kinase KdpD